MRFLPLILFTGCAVAPPAPMAPGFPDLGRDLPALSDSEKVLSLRDGLAAAARHIEARESAERLDRAIALLRHLSAGDPGNPAIDLALAEAHSRACELLDLKKPADRPEHKAQRAAALTHIDAAFRAKPDEGAVQYWRAAILLHHAEAEQSYKRVQEAHGLLHKAAGTVPSIDSGGPARLLARVYQETPGFPFLGSKPKAVEWYGRSLQVAPAFIQTNLWLGETHAQLKQPDKARYYLEKAVTLPLRPGHEREDGGFRATARALLKTLPAPP